MRKITKKLKTKSDIISEIAKKKNLSLSITTLFVDTVFEEITQALLKEYKVEFRGFGSFGVKRYKAYKGRNPKNQKKIMVRAKRRPWFKAGIIRWNLNQE